MWLNLCALSAIACGTSHDPVGTSSGSGGNGRAGDAAQSGGAGTGRPAAGYGGAAGSAGKHAGSGGASGDAGSGGKPGSAAGSGDDAGAPACAPCIDGSISWGNIGGFVAFTEESTLDACNAYQHTRSSAAGGATPMLHCQRPLPCMGSGLHGVSDVLQALQHADVQATAGKGTVLFGSDPRPVDGTVFEIVLGRSTTIDVGGACASSASCKAIPAGITALADLLRSIDDEQLHLDPCRALFGK
jgi:hypothetical protein